MPPASSKTNLIWDKDTHCKVLAGKRGAVTGFTGAIEFSLSKSADRALNIAQMLAIVLARREAGESLLDYLIITYPIPSLRVHLGQ